MKIIGTGTVKPGGDVSRKKASSGAGGDFGKILESELAETKQAEAVSHVNPVDSVLALQQVGDEEVDRKKTMAYGSDLLDGLERLRNQLLLGEVSLSQLKSIEARMKNYRKGFIDPTLSSIIDDIEVRVAVEVAKYERYVRSESPSKDEG